MKYPVIVRTLFVATILACFAPAAFGQACGAIAAVCSVTGGTMTRCVKNYPAATYPSLMTPSPICTVSMNTNVTSCLGESVGYFRGRATTSVMGVKVCALNCMGTANCTVTMDNSDGMPVELMEFSVDE